ncbi:MSMEG_0570 family nitrogen starvation response protein [Nocardioides sp. ChNu-153]|uniref:MSMEG_0570 family nitrogen starvation response protein n=1 Tax=Nocardioides sp. ChNu-153 TaxID=2779364 RepID=UPI00264C1B21|nr:MSMEG_0570 family nitrogen starvation response protein [Nocardioides sp. ChNu-153]MDN7123230.1 MSMEG_0570 family nitrogen starvation response protein [Nocardioides sp. ChNu-153]
MPELTFTVRWPDGAVTDCWSPSLVVHDHLDAGASYTVREFRDRAAAALAEGSERVRARYGFACSASAASLERIDALVAAHAPDARVEVLRLHPPLPQETSR